MAEGEGGGGGFKVIAIIVILIVVAGGAFYFYQNGTFNWLFTGKSGSGGSDRTSGGGSNSQEGDPSPSGDPPPIEPEPTPDGGGGTDPPTGEEDPPPDGGTGEGDGTEPLPEETPPEGDSGFRIPVPPLIAVAILILIILAYKRKKRPAGKIEDVYDEEKGIEQERGLVKDIAEKKFAAIKSWYESSLKAKKYKDGIHTRANEIYQDLLNRFDPKETKKPGDILKDRFVEVDIKDYPKLIDNLRAWGEKNGRFTPDYLAKYVIPLFKITKRHIDGTKDFDGLMKEGIVRILNAQHHQDPDVKRYAESLRFIGRTGEGLKEINKALREHLIGLESKQQAAEAKIRTVLQDEKKQMGMLWHELNGKDESPLTRARYERLLVDLEKHLKTDQHYDKELKRLIIETLHLNHVITAYANHLKIEDNNIDEVRESMAEYLKGKIIPDFERIVFGKPVGLYDRYYGKKDRSMRSALTTIVKRSFDISRRFDALVHGFKVHDEKIEKDMDTIKNSIKKVKGEKPEEHINKIKSMNWEKANESAVEDGRVENPDGTHHYHDPNIRWR